MTMNEEIIRMHAAILNLRSATMTCATAIIHFPPCGEPGGEHPLCEETGAKLQQIYRDIHELLMSARITLNAVLSPTPKSWDELWSLAGNKMSPEQTLASFGQELVSDQEEYIRYYGQIDDEMMKKLGDGFSEQEWEVLGVEGAWQNGHRLPQILQLLEYLEAQMDQKTDLQLLLMRDCKLNRSAGEFETATV